MDKKRKSFIVVVSAPSGSGKTTVVSGVLERLPGTARSISYTTRTIRDGEENGKDYFFVSREEFEKRKNEGDFLEFEENFDNSYGTSREQVAKALEEGNDIILSIDVRGARSVKKAFPESVSVFIMPPSEEVLAARLIGRKTEDKEQLALRLNEAKKELEASEEYDYMVINDDLDKAIDELKTIIEQERANRESIAKEKEEEK